MGFEQYERGSDLTDEQPLVSLRASGSIGLNDATVDAYFEDTDDAGLYYDPETDRVGVEPATDDSGDEYTVQRGEASNHGATLTAAGFLREYDLLPQRTTKYAVERDDDEGFVVIGLDEPVSRTADFVEVVTGKVRDWATGRTDVRAHYHLDSDAHRPAIVDEFEALVDVSVTLDEHGEVTGIRR